MNRSNIEHFLLFLAATLFYKLGVPAWLYLAAAAILIELDQAREWVNRTNLSWPFRTRWYEWFKLRDTQLDLFGDALGIAVIYLLFWLM